MDIVVPTGDLAAELEFAQPIVGGARSKAIPILGNVLLQAAGNRLEIVATDTEVGLRTSCEADVREPGAVTLPARKLMELAKSLPGQSLAIRGQDGQPVALTAGAYRGRLQTLPASDYPRVADATGDQAVLAGATLRDMVARTRFAVGETAQYYINGAFLACEDGKIVMVCTDGRRMSLASAPCAATVAETIVPRLSLAILATLLATAGGDVTFTRGENHVFFQAGRRLLVSRLVDGKFPPYKRLLPPPAGRSLVEIDRQALLAALRRVRLTLNDTRCLQVALTAAGCGLSSAGALGDGAEQVEAAYAGADMAVGLDAEFLADFLEVADTARVRLSVKDKTSAVTLEPVDAPVGHTYVLMPMAL